MHFDKTSDQSSHQSISNINYKADLNHTVQYTRWLLKILGIWPLVSKTSSRAEKYFSKILLVLCPLIMAFTLIPPILHMIFREKDPIVRLMLFGPIGFCLTNFIKYGFIFLRRDTIKRCIEHVEMDWMLIEGENDRTIMRKNVTVGRGLTAVCAIFIYTGGMSYHTIMPFCSGKMINEFNETVRPIVYPGYEIFVDPQLSPTYEIIFFILCVAALITYTVTTAACNLAAIFVTHACGQFQIVISRLGSLVDGIDENRNSKKLQKRISFVIECHMRVLNLSSKIEQVLREICLVEVVASTFIICLLEYYCMAEWNNSETVRIITYLVLLISLSFNIFIFCHIGELLKEQCHEIGKATYMIEWYRLPGKTGLALVMVIAMSNYPRKLTAGRFMELSIGSFGGVIKSSLMYLNMLRTAA